MSFWRDASPVVKGAVVFGAIALVLLIGMQLLDDGGAEVAPARGIPSAAP